MKRSKQMTQNKEMKKFKISTKEIIIFVLGGLFLLFWAPAFFYDTDIIAIICLIIFILIYFVPMYISHKTNGPLSKNAKLQHPFNRLIYLAFNVNLIILLFIYSCVDGYFAREETFIKTLFYILLVLEIILGCLWIGTDLIRKDFPWGIPRVIGRVIRSIFVFMGAFIIYHTIEQSEAILGIVGFVGFCILMGYGYDTSSGGGGGTSSAQRFENFLDDIEMACNASEHGVRLTNDEYLRRQELLGDNSAKEKRLHNAMVRENLSEMFKNHQNKK